MLAVTNFDAFSFLNSLISLVTAFMLGCVVGFERQFRQRSAGLRTNVLVAVGAAIFVDMAMRAGGTEGAIRVAATVVSGVGFLGAGVIMRDNGSIRGINTAATLWASAAIGACAGADLIAEAILATLFILAANTLLRPLVNNLNRAPINSQLNELTHAIHVIADSEQRKSAMAGLNALLRAKNYPLAELKVKPFGENEVEIEATLMASSISEEEMKHLILELNRTNTVRQAYWLPRITD